MFEEGQQLKAKDLNYIVDQATYGIDSNNTYTFGKSSNTPYKVKDGEQFINPLVFRCKVDVKQTQFNTDLSSTATHLYVMIGQLAELPIIDENNQYALSVGGYWTLDESGEMVSAAVANAYVIGVDSDYSPNGNIYARIVNEQSLAVNDDKDKRKYPNNYIAGYLPECNYDGWVELPIENLNKCKNLWITKLMCFDSKSRVIGNLYLFHGGVLQTVSLNLLATVKSTIMADTRFLQTDKIKQVLSFKLQSVVPKGTTDKVKCEFENGLHEGHILTRIVVQEPWHISPLSFLFFHRYYLIGTKQLMCNAYELSGDIITGPADASYGIPVLDGPNILVTDVHNLSAYVTNDLSSQNYNPAFMTPTIICNVLPGSDGNLGVVYFTRYPVIPTWEAYQF